jgi:caffeoyl-CoA O-methyltransferase
MHRLVSEQIHAYSEQYSTPSSAVLNELERQTHLRTELPIMLSGHLQGRMLSLISKMIQPNFIVEIGTFTGYSAICLAEGLAKNGKLLTLDVHEEVQELAKEFIAKAGMQNCIECCCMPASEYLPTITTPIDLVFIDADKVNYIHYFDLVIDKVRPGGFIIADNVLYNGEVVDLSTADKNAKAMHAYNEKIKLDPRVENVLLPIRDGIMLSRKIEVKL